MEIFIGNIPDGITSNELRRFVNGVLDDRKVGFQFWKKKQPSSMRFKVIERQVEGGACYHYAIAAIEPLASARECCELLNQQFFQGKPLNAREYYSRSYMNERRMINWRERPWGGIERRQGERRRRVVLQEAAAAVPAMP